MNIRSIINDSTSVIASLESLVGLFEQASKLLIGTLESGGKILICGNGGSAADAMHFSTELVCRFEKERRHFPAICLNSSSSDLTAFSNDFSFDEVFSRQLEAFGTNGDLLIVLSTSGMSANIVTVLEAAHLAGIESIALLGRDGGACRGKATVELIVASESTARIQEAHKVLVHALCSSVDEVFQ